MDQSSVSAAHIHDLGDGRKVIGRNERRRDCVGAASGEVIEAGPELWVFHAVIEEGHTIDLLKRHPAAEHTAPQPAPGLVHRL